MNKELLLSAPKVKRTHCYVLKPAEYSIPCPLCGGSNVNWSEFEKHIWCYDCEKDIFIPLMDAGIFSGPIPIQLCAMMGMSFDRINIETGDVVTFDPDNTEPFEKTWVRDEALEKYQFTLTLKTLQS